MVQRKDLAPKCADCGKLIRQMMGPGGRFVTGCEACWKANGYEGDPPCNMAKGDAEQKNDEIMNKMQGLQEKKSPAEIEEEKRAEASAKKLEALKQKNPLKQALHVLIHNIKEKNLSELELFQEIDQDGDGNLTRGEMAAALRKLGCKLLPAELDAVLRIFDVDGSGEIDFSEFYSVLKAEERELDELPENQVDPRLCGFEVGERVRMRCKLFKDISNHSSNDPNDHGMLAEETGKVMGPSSIKNALLVTLDRTGESLTIKAGMVEKWAKPIQHGKLCLCDKCFKDMLDMAEESDDEGLW